MSTLNIDRHFICVYLKLISSIKNKPLGQKLFKLFHLFVNVKYLEVLFFARFSCRGGVLTEEAHWPGHWGLLGGGGGQLKENFVRGESLMEQKKYCAT